MPSKDHTSSRISTIASYDLSGNLISSTQQDVVVSRTHTVWDANPGDKITPTAFQLTKNHEEMSGHSRWWTNGVVTQTLSEHGIGSTIGPAPFEPTGITYQRARNRALSNLYANVKGRSAIDIGTSGAELVSTRGSLSVKKAARDLVRAAKRSNFPGTKVIGSAWLAWHYAWRPAIDDLWDAVGVRLYDDATRTVTRSGRGREVEFNDVTIYGSGSHQCRSTLSFSVRCHAQATYRVSSPNLLALQRITTLNPALIAWNLLPLSFVADWVVDISGYLELMEASLGLGLEFVSGFETETRLYRATDTVSGKNSFGFEENATGSRRYVLIRRTPVASFPRPTAPSVNVDLGSSQLKATAALLTTLLKK